MNIYTIPKYRKQGIATVLFVKVIEEAKSLGYTKIVLHATDKGKNLYLKYGFKDSGNEMILNL